MFTLIELDFCFNPGGRVIPSTAGREEKLLDLDDILLTPPQLPGSFSAESLDRSEFCRYIMFVLRNLGTLLATILPPLFFPELLSLPLSGVSSCKGSILSWLSRLSGTWIRDMEEANAARDSTVDCRRARFGSDINDAANTDGLSGLKSGELLSMATSGCSSSCWAEKVLSKESMLLLPWMRLLVLLLLESPCTRAIGRLLLRGDRPVLGREISGVVPSSPSALSVDPVRGIWRLWGRLLLVVVVLGAVTGRESLGGSLKVEHCQWRISKRGLSGSGNGFVTRCATKGDSTGSSFFQVNLGSVFN